MKRPAGERGGEWMVGGPNICSEENKQLLTRITEDEGPLIVEHWHYGHAASPDWNMFESVEDFTKYLDECANPGDDFRIWSFYRLCREENMATEGKFPDQDGKVPVNGAY